jgi:hypothetical protein
VFERQRKRCSRVSRTTVLREKTPDKREDEWNNDSHPSLSSWCEGNVDESSVVLCPLPWIVSHVLTHVCGWMDGWQMASWILER